MCYILCMYVCYYTHRVLMIICHLVKLCYPQLLWAPVLTDRCQSYSLIVCRRQLSTGVKDQVDELGCHNREQIGEVVGGEKDLIFSKNGILLYSNSQNLSNVHA